MSHIKPIILFASRTGGVEALAYNLRDNLTARGIASECASCDEFDFARLEEPDTFALILVSTYRAGGPPPTGLPLRHWLYELDERDSLDPLEYAVFGLGSSQYQNTYLAFARFVDERMSDQGAERVIDMGEGDVRGDPAESFAAWENAVMAHVESRYGTAAPRKISAAMWQSGRHSGVHAVPALVH